MERPLFGRSDIKGLSSPGLCGRRRARSFTCWRRDGNRITGCLLAVFADEADELPVADHQSAFVLRIDARHRRLEAQLAHDLRKKRVKRDATVPPFRPRLLSFLLAPLALTHLSIDYHLTAANSNLQKSDKDRLRWTKSAGDCRSSPCGRRLMDGDGRSRSKPDEDRQRATETVSVGREFWMARCVMWAYIGRADAPLTPFLTRFARRKTSPLSKPRPSD